MIKANSYPGSSTKDDWTYHDLPFGEHKSHRRNTQMRVDLMKTVYDFKGKKGIDFGCNVGGFCFRLKNEGADVKGIDYDEQSIRFARRCNVEYGYNIQFIDRKITRDFVENLALHDFCIFLDCWMWIEKSEGYENAKYILKKISEKCEVMFFSTSQNDGMARNEIKCARDVENLLRENTVYKNIRNLGVVKDGWHQRTMFFCWGYK